jgi:signal transduction histidine kinase/CheY-like chemotaxis protein
MRDMRSALRAGLVESGNVGPNSIALGRWSRLIDAIEQLATTASLEDVIEILRSNARGIVEANGIAIILKDEDKCYYVAEDAEAPLWAGQRFPANTCISGHAMIDAETIIIPDIFKDPRVPIAAYEPTFVRSIAMVPIGSPPVAAMGAYWDHIRTPEDNEVAMLEALARSAATALENARLIGSLRDLNAELEARVVERTAELERSHEALRQTQKMETVGKLTGNVAHDFNNLLTPIIGSVELVLHRGPTDARSEHMLSRALEAAERAQLLVQRLLSFARQQPLRPIALDLRKLIDGTQDLLSSTLGPRVKLDIDLPPHLPFVLADGNQLDLAILNIAVNARDAMPDGGTLSISAKSLTDKDDRPKDVPDGEFISLSIRDTGIGMDSETATRAIEPFFTTKGLGEGTGLGLSMAEGLMGQLGGKLIIDSRPGEGTTISLFLPQAGIPIRQPKEASKDEFPTEKSRGTILLIDDDELVRAGTADMLAELGFDVMEASTADQGLGVLETAPTLSAVVTDHLMPGMTGAELARKLKDEHPALPVLLISGYQNIETIAPDIPRLSKPFRHKQLGASIALLLGESGLH